MRLSDELLDVTTEFLEDIANEEDSCELADAIDALREFISEEVDGWTKTDPLKFVRIVQSRIEEIWGLVSKDEKHKNNLLKSFYEELTEHLENLGDQIVDFEEVESERNEWGYH